MRSHYDVCAAIRYYGQLPNSVRIESGQVICPPPPKLVAGLGIGSFPIAEVPGFVTLGDIKPFPLSGWKEPPHVALANLRADLTDSGPVRKFTKEYGYLAGIESAGSWRVDLVGLVDFQNQVRDAWRGNAYALQLGLRGASDVFFSVGPKQNELSIGSLRTLIEVVTLQDCAGERLGLCANTDCPAPFFLKVRKGQNFCSHRCAVLINVRRFREREKKVHARRRIKR